MCSIHQHALHLPGVHSVPRAIVLVTSDIAMVAQRRRGAVSLVSVRYARVLRSQRGCKRHFAASLAPESVVVRESPRALRRARGRSIPPDGFVPALAFERASVTFVDGHVAPC
jgi:prepilin-type processing-associated H-X9-DG protein